MVGLMENMAQCRDSIENVEPKTGDDPPSQYLGDQSDSTKPREAVGGHKEKRPNLGGPIDVIRSAVRLRRLVGGRSTGWRKAQLGQVKAQKRTKSRGGKI